VNQLTLQDALRIAQAETRRLPLGRAWWQNLVLTRIKLSGRWDKNYYAEPGTMGNFENIAGRCHAIRLFVFQRTRAMNCFPRPSLPGAMGVSLLNSRADSYNLPPPQQVYRPSTQQGGKGSKSKRWIARWVGRGRWLEVDVTEREGR
jgi:hypothetical protein